MAWRPHGAQGMEIVGKSGFSRSEVERLGTQGLLFLGMAESLLAVRDGSLSPLGRSHVTGVQPLRAVGPAIYGHAPKAGAPRSVRRPLRVPRTPTTERP